MCRCACVVDRHRAINLFLMSYKEQWLQVEPPGHSALIEDITVCHCSTFLRPVMLTRPAGHEAKAEAEATMYEAEAEARHFREQLSVYKHKD